MQYKFEIDTDSFTAGANKARRTKQQPRYSRKYYPIQYAGTIAVPVSCQRHGLDNTSELLLLAEETAAVKTKLVKLLKPYGLEITNFQLEWQESTVDMNDATHHWTATIGVQ